MIGVFKEMSPQESALGFYSKMSTEQINQIQAKVTQVLNTYGFNMTMPMKPGVADPNMVANVQSAQVALGVQKLDGKWGKSTDARNDKFVQGQTIAQKSLESVKAIGVGSREYATGRIAGVVPEPTAIAAREASQKPKTTEQVAYKITLSVSETGMSPTEITLRSAKPYDALKPAEQRELATRALKMAHEKQFGVAAAAHDFMNPDATAAEIRHIKTEKISG